MNSPVVDRHISGVDAGFLYLERKEIPLHIACVSIFEEPIPFDEFVASVDSRLDLLPRYRQVITAAPYSIGHPTWQPDPNFDIRNHIFRLSLPPRSGQAELEALAGRILSEPLDRGKPLWDIHVVDGLKNGRGALILRVHHALADGVAGVSILNVILDTTPDGSRPADQARSSQPPACKPGRSVLGAFLDSVRSIAEGLICAEAGLVELAGTVSAGHVREEAQTLLAVLPELLAPVRRLPFNKPCGGERKFCWAEMDMEEVKGIRDVAGGTVNDIILTVVVRALARYVELHGETIANRLVRIVCPVNLRTDTGESLGNQITFLPVVLPLEAPDPVRHLQGVAARMDIMKKTPATDLMALLGSCIHSVPPPLQSLFWSGLPRVTFPVPLLNMICTNIPGSKVPLYAVGKRLLSNYPQVPTGYELGIGCAVHSYDGKLSFGLIADAQVGSDVGRLRDFLKVSFAELCRAAGVKRVRRPAAAAQNPRRPAGRSRPVRPASEAKPAMAAQATSAGGRR